jgi:hypothetical protein
MYLTIQELFDIFTQAGATILSVLAVYLAGKKNKWGFACGLASQPFWYATTIYHHQWILTIVNIAFTVSWVIGFKEWFFEKKQDVNTQKNPEKSENKLGIDFRLSRYTYEGRTAVEILLDGAVVGSLYAEDYRSVKLASPCIDEMYEEDISILPSIQGIIVNFNPDPM